MRGGYRGPHVLDEPDFDDGRFEDQFEHDGHGLTFRKFGRGRPVRVTQEERDELVARYGRINTVITMITVVALAVWILTSAWWLESDFLGQGRMLGGIVVIGCFGWFVRNRVWKRLVSRFERRTPVGPDRTRIDQYRAKAVAMSWSEIALMALGGSSFLLLIATFGRLSDLLDAVTAGITVTAACAFAALKYLAPASRY